MNSAGFFIEAQF